MTVEAELLKQIEARIEESKENAEELRKIYRTIGELVSKGRAELMPLMAKVREYLSEAVEKEKEPSVSITKLSSIYFDKIKDAHQVLSLISEQNRYRIEEGKKMPISAKENLKLALGYLKSQLETVERLLGGGV